MSHDLHQAPFSSLLLSFITIHCHSLLIFSQTFWGCFFYLYNLVASFHTSAFHFFHWGTFFLFPLDCILIISSLDSLALHLGISIYISLSLFPLRLTCIASRILTGYGPWLLSQPFSSLCSLGSCLHANLVHPWLPSVHLIIISCACHHSYSSFWVLLFVLAMSYCLFLLHSSSLQNILTMESFILVLVTESFHAHPLFRCSVIRILSFSSVSSSYPIIIHVGIIVITCITHYVHHQTRSHPSSWIYSELSGVEEIHHTDPAG